jgi:hypothetical protein
MAGPCEVADAMVLPFELTSSTLSPPQADVMVLRRLAAQMGIVLAAPSVDVVLRGGAELLAVVTALTRTWCELLWEG